MGQMCVDVGWARQRTVTVLRRAGLTEGQAALVADALVEAELRGRATHGLIRLKSILERLKKMARRPVRIAIDRGAMVLVDGGNELGYIVSDFCTRLVIERCRAHGLALVAAHDTTHAGMLGYFVEPIARADLVGVAFTNCARTTAPAGATEAVFGTNPLAVAIPFVAQSPSAGPDQAHPRAGVPPFPAEGDPILLDFSTSAGTIGDLLLAAEHGEVLPVGVAVDAEGNPTCDPREARKGALLPFGAHKGSGLALVIQVLSTAFTGAKVFPVLGRDYGYVVLALDPYAFVSREAFQASVRELVAGMKSARRAPGVAEVLLPGERAFRTRRERLGAGLELTDDVFGLLSAPQERSPSGRG